MLKVFGTGLWNITDVKFDGETVFTPDLDRSTTEMSSVVVSPVEEAGAVEVTISNKLGGRNTVNFTCQKKKKKNRKPSSLLFACVIGVLLVSTLKRNRTKGSTNSLEF